MNTDETIREKYLLCREYTTQILLHNYENLSRKTLATKAENSMVRLLFGGSGGKWPQIITQYSFFSPSNIQFSF